MARALALLVFLPCVLASSARSLVDSDWTSIEASNLQRTLRVRVAAVICSSFSVVASLVAFYWFCRMEKRFRHRLIMLLIYGDLMRATWFFIFAVVAVVRGAVRTESAFCQSSGFFIQYGTETSDYAVLVIAVNSALQVFRPSTQTTSGGLYPYQRYVYVGALLIPVLMSGLAFIGTRQGYLSQGAFCTLPIRPIWYRLALAWIPRYLIALVIICLAIAIYAYVGFEFRAYSTLSQSVGTSMSLTATSVQQSEKDPDVHADASMMAEGESFHGRRVSSIAKDIVSSQRRASSVSFTCEGPSSNHASFKPGGRTQSLPNNSINISTRCNDSTLRPPLAAILSGSTFQSPDSITEGRVVPAPGAVIDANRSPVLQDLNPLEDRQSRSPSPSSPPGQRHMSRQLVNTKKLHARVYRQLRLMFIYPLAYTLMWLVPFAQQCTLYKYKYAQHPLWFLRLGATICLSSMGFVDCLIFSLKEKPWRKIQNSDGTFWGSFAIFAPWLMKNKPVSKDVEHGGGGPSNEGSGRRGIRLRSSIHTNSTSNDYAQVAAEQARVRLDLERDERLVALRARIAKRRAESAWRADDDDDDSGSNYEDGSGNQHQPTPKDEDQQGKGKAVKV
ncbi:uncharacterized protein K460DRAFT_127804 [Cucurbitaria berberidis CBS 394.84]|uniref:Uncharacterized protein n=1 Tax=Cucurbitaria berberidis CBS 394.84 TaxID=1168544 RepID=A0A9P4GJB5_9PLEO|nr:uncharacterized protein K460DRAFT_127804 [Cucurbitaria berberidis CBS 394.84]KAF1846645.1 hypothetical protein K460DRAFT_127804 [Cucurbitaria berberidis CBS 394.84]